MRPGEHYVYWLPEGLRDDEVVGLDDDALKVRSTLKRRGVPDEVKESSVAIRGEPKPARTAGARERFTVGRDSLDCHVEVTTVEEGGKKLSAKTWYHSDYPFIFRREVDGKVLLHLMAKGPETSPDVREARTPALTPRLTLDGHKNAVTALAISPKGTTIATGSVDRTIRLWDAKTGRPTHTLTGHAGQVWALAFTRDGATLLSYASGRMGLRHWDVASGRQLREVEYEGGGKAVFTLAADRYAFGGRMGGAYVWGTSSWRDLGSFNTEYTTSVDAVAFSPDGSKLAAGIRSGHVFLFDARTRKRLHLFPKKRGYMDEGNTKAVAAAVGHTWVRSAAFSPDGKLLATGGGSEVILWSVGERRYIGEMPVEKGASDLTFVGERLFASCDDGKVRVFDPTTRQCLHTLKTGSAAEAFVVAPDGKSFVTAPANSWSACVWDVP